MDTIFIKPDDSKTSKPLNITDKIDLWRGEKS